MGRKNQANDVLRLRKGGTVVQDCFETSAPELYVMLLRPYIESIG